MNWKLIIQLSIFGLIMAFGTVSLIPEKTEPLFWLLIFIFCAWVIARVCTSRYFLHGFMVSMVNAVWITVVHAIYYNKYMAAHSDLSIINNSMPAALAIHPRVAMLLTAPIFGIIFGLVLGLFSLIASKFIKSNQL